MRVTSIVRLFCAATAFAFAQQAGTGVISGTVVEASSGDGVRKAVVTLTWHGTPRTWATTRTDASGEFRFDGLPAGNYDLRANKAGFGSAIYGSTSTHETGETITLAEGERRDGLKLRFIHSASISGHVLDSPGDPVIGARVMLLRSGRNFGRRILVNAGPSGTSDDRGEYHFAGVAPGQYYLFTGETGFRRPTPPDQPPQFLGSQYYGGATEWKDATVITVKDGDVLGGMDFALIPQTGVRIRGRVAGVPEAPAEAPVPDGPRPAGIVPMRKFATGQQIVQVSVMPLDEVPMRFSQGAGAAGPEYSFDIGWLAPGQYRVVANVHVDGKVYAASQAVDARSGSVDTALTLAPAIDLKGRIRVEGESGQKGSFNIGLVRALENGVNPYGNGAPSAQAGSDGKFTLPQVTSDEWELNINTLPRGAYLKSVHYGDQDVLFKTIEVKPGAEAALDIVVSMHTAKIHGEVDASAAAGARAAILLAPVGRFHDLARYYCGILADDHGKFEMMGLAPGRYKVYAVEKLAVSGFRNPEAADQVSALFPEFVQEIELGEDADLEVHPKLIPTERAREILP